MGEFTLGFLAGAGSTIAFLALYVLVIWKTYRGIAWITDRRVGKRWQT